MIDPITAFATAQAAIKGVQAAIKMGKDIQAVSGDLMKFFDAKDVVVKAANTPKKSAFGKSDTAQAFETVMQAKALHDAETQLKNMIIWSGNPDVWDSLLRERNRIVAERKAEELAAQRKKEKRQQELADLANWLFWGASLAALVVFVAWLTWLFVESTKG